jgi:hypothetical protein
MKGNEYYIHLAALMPSSIVARPLLNDILAVCGIKILKR